MSKGTRNHVDDLRGASRLAIVATKGVTDLVEAMHLTIAGGPALLGSPLRVPARLITAPVYGSIRAVASLVGLGIDAALSQLTPFLGESTPGPEREAVLAVLNGVLGDYLEETHNPLAIQMNLRRDGRPLELEPAAMRRAFPDAKGKVLLLVHGSSMYDGQWSKNGHDHGAALGEALGYSVLYVHYNSGLHVSTNGAALAELLERALAAWPVDVSEVAIVAHSMGGLVARSACREAETAGYGWRTKLRKLVFLGTPHHGAPLERGGNWVGPLLSISRYSAPLARLGKIRSAGVTDLRHGNVRREDWEGRDRFALGEDVRTHLPLPDGVDCMAIAASTSKPDAKSPSGDGLVPVDSALGRHRSPARTLVFGQARTRIVYETGHLEMLGSAEVFEAIRSFLA